MNTKTRSAPALAVTQTLRRSANMQRPRSGQSELKTQPKESSHAICRWICRTRSEEKPAGLPPHGAEDGQGLAASRRDRIPRIRRRRRQDGKADVVPAERQAQAQ